MIRIWRRSGRYLRKFRREGPAAARWVCAASAKWNRQRVDPTRGLVIELCHLGFTVADEKLQVDGYDDLTLVPDGEASLAQWGHKWREALKDAMLKQTTDAQIRLQSSHEPAHQLGAHIYIGSGTSPVRPSAESRLNSFFVEACSPMLRPTSTPLRSRIVIVHGGVAVMIPQASSLLAMLVTLEQLRQRWGMCDHSLA